jgi:kinesin family protein 5
VDGDGEPHKFIFDAVFGVESDQAGVYEKVAKQQVIDVMDGYNATVFAYGQTGAGKTHTMEGPNHTDEVHKGLIPRIVNNIFELVLVRNPFSIFLSWTAIDWACSLPTSK